MWPWDWVIAAGRGVVGLSQKVVDYINSVIASVMSWVTSAIASIWSGLGTLVSDVALALGQAINFAENLVKQVWDALEFLSRTLNQLVYYLFNTAWQYIQGIFNWVVGQLARLEANLLSWANDVYQWVLREVYDPLKRAYDGMLNWATGWFNQIWQYIQHPELLVQLIGAFLLRMWLQYVLRFAAVFTRWIVRNMMGMAGEVFDVLENILSNIL